MLAFKVFVVTLVDGDLVLETLPRSVNQGLTGTHGFNLVTGGVELLGEGSCAAADVEDALHAFGDIRENKLAVGFLRFGEVEEVGLKAVTEVSVVEVVGSEEKFEGVEEDVEAKFSVGPLPFSLSHFDKPLILSI